MISCNAKWRPDAYSKPHLACNVVPILLQSGTLRQLYDNYISFRLQRHFHIFSAALWFPLKFDLINVTGMLQAYNGAAKHAIALLKQ